MGYDLKGQSKDDSCHLVSNDHCQEHESLGRVLAVMHPAINDGLVKYNVQCKCHCMWSFWSLAGDGDSASMRVDYVVCVHGCKCM